MKVLVKIDRMDNGDLVIYTKSGDAWIRHGFWENDSQVVSFQTEIELPDAASGSEK